jgi:ribosomal protein L11 methyltransferase
LKRYLYELPEEELWTLMALKPVPLEVVGRREGRVRVASYEPLQGLEPLKVEEVVLQENWRSFFGPLEVGGLVIVPPWKRVIFIKPGMAFGTGLHPTTRLCLKALQELLRPGDTVLDVGTGSGILAIASKVLGAGRVVALDVSPDAVRECIGNSSLNGVEVECLLGRARDVEGTFDLVVANLEISVFREEMEDIVSRSGGKLILSGLYGREDLEEVLAMIRQHGFEPSRIFEEENWFCVGVGDAGS